MPSVFSKIIAGDLPGHVVYQDDVCVALLTVAPLRPGHTLVVPREEIPQWTQANEETWAHVSALAHRIGRTVQHLWKSPRVGLLAQGFEVAHVHLHVWPAWGPEDFDLSAARPTDDHEALAAHADRLRRALSTSAGQEHS